MRHVRPPLIALAYFISALGHAGLLGSVTWRGNHALRARGSEVGIEISPAPGSAPKHRRPEHRHAEPRARQPVPVDSPSMAARSSEEARAAAPLTAALAPAASARDAGGHVRTGVLGEEDVDVPARLASPPRLRYPRDAYDAGAEGDVELFLIVDEAGRVVSAQVARAAGRGFDEAALVAARELRFEPALKDGQRVAVHVHWTCRFRLDD